MTFLVLNAPQIKSRINLNEKPAPKIMARGIGSAFISQHHLDGTFSKPMNNGKPPYQVPTMDEIRSIPWNGLKVASTFSGCGGSCLGYRMAGFRVVWANEFVPAAQASYNANKHPSCHLDGRDIRKINTLQILDQTGLEMGELDLFDGSPPCQAFSTAGKRHKGWGKEKSYEHGAKQYNEKLFDEYIRLLRGLMPKVFIAENVSGLIKGTAKGMFIEILKALKASGYRVKCKVLDAQWLGVPQRRRRTIFMGIRNDLNMDPVYPEPWTYQYTVADALPWISDVRQSVFNGTDQRSSRGKPCPTVCSSGGIGAALGNQWWVERKTIAPSRLKNNGASPGNDLAIESRNDKPRRFTIAELKRICAFPDDFILTGSYAQQWERLGNSVPPLMMKAVAEVVRDRILSPTCTLQGACKT